jgi:hypothetical protein
MSKKKSNHDTTRYAQAHKRSHPHTSTTKTYTTYIPMGCLTVFTAATAAAAAAAAAAHAFSFLLLPARANYLDRAKVISYDIWEKMRVRVDIDVKNESSKRAHA